ncbi:MAG: hypothetical protein SFU21_05020 [Flavihumibacter sp.]|nr:hypothetical protein [Flavihumibacter sp.]
MSSVLYNFDPKEKIANDLLNNKASGRKLIKALLIGRKPEDETEEIKFDYTDAQGKSAKAIIKEIGIKREQ